jgi:hypothetical protein
MGLFGRSRQKEEGEKELDISPIQEESPVEPEQRHGNFLPVPRCTRQADPNGRPSKFSERLSIATATSSEIGQTSRAPRLEHPLQLAPNRAPSTRGPPPPPSTASQRAPADKGSRASPVQQPLPARTASKGFQPPQRLATFEEKTFGNGARPGRPGMQRRQTTAQSRYMWGRTSEARSLTNYKQRHAPSA